VRALAAAAGVPTAAKKDSQGVCFIGPLDMKGFLATAIRPRRGPVVHADGRALGQHEGAGYYTIGQRHGLDIREGGGPYYVIRKDMKTNTLTVGPASMLEQRVVMVRKPVWIGAPPTSALRASIRYRMKPVPVRVDGTTLRFTRPVSAVASGQSVVFYEGSRIAGGTIVR
jgi:tRNA-specific 2-thiouridylase